MNIIVGTNIKKYRTAKNITQEQLAEAIGVSCTAVSKWERNETYPDITLLFPLAHYFDVSVDDLMGYNRAAYEREIEDLILRYRTLYREDFLGSRALITDAYHKYPGDFRIMHAYMWNLAGDYADNDLTVLLEKKEEFSSICERILFGCDDERLKLDAWNMKAKLLHAEGKTEEALKIYQTHFPNWYTTVGQKSEQLFAKDTPEFLYWCKKNLQELAFFTADKISKCLFFDPDVPHDKAVKELEDIGGRLYSLYDETRNPVFAVMAESLLARLRDDLKYRDHRTEKELEELSEKISDCRRVLEHL